MRNIRKTNLFMLLTVCYIITLTITLPYLVRYISKLIGGVIMPDIAFLFITQILTQMLPFIVYLIITKKKARDVLPFSNPGIKNFIYIFFMALLVQPLMMLLSAISNIFYNNTVSEVIDRLYKDDLTMLISVMTISVMPSICEEFVYRGIIYSGYKKAPIIVSALVNGLFFGIMHLNPQQFLYAFLLGCIFSYAIYYTKSIYIPMFFHFVINFSQLALAAVFWKISESNVYIMTTEDIATGLEAAIEPYMDPVIVAVISMGILSLIFTPLFIMVLRSFIDHNKRRNKDKDIGANKEIGQDEEQGEPFKLKCVFNISFFAIIITYCFHIFINDF